MSWLGWALVIFLTALVTLLGTAVLTGRGDKLERTQLRARLEEGIGRVELPRAGLLPLDHLPETGPSGPWLEPEPFDLPGVLAAVYDPFPVDTGPLLFLSEQAAANAALEREIPRLCAEAEAKIPPRWRS